MLYKKSMDIKKIRLILWFLVAIAVIVFAYSYNSKNDKKTTQNVMIKNFGGNFTLTNHLGETVNQDNFKNKNRLIYFGFTYCPAICPTELQRISSTLEKLNVLSENIQPIFITVDPERDTVPVLKSYLSLFHDKFIGLTGTEEQIDAVKKAYKIYANKVQEDDMNDYTMDHSSFIYFMDENNDLIRIFKVDDTIDHMTDVIKNHLNK